MPPKLGILAGGGDLPALMISACRASDREFFVLAFEGQAEPEIVEAVPHAWVRLGASGKALSLLREAGAEDLVMAGRITRPSLAGLRPDKRALRFLGTLGKAAFGDDSLLSAIIAGLEKEGFRVIGAETLIDGLLADEGIYGAHAPDELARSDIERGVEVARGIGALDVGQAVVVQDGIVLGAEAVEGTDALLARCRLLRREGPGGVLVKMRKPQQERRVDLPTIGVETIVAAAAAGLRGVAIEAGGAMVIDRSKVVAAADGDGLFVIGVPVPA